MLGDGIPKNPKEAEKWFRRAADTGDPDGQFGLAMLYNLGEGVRKDLAKAIKWCRLAAAQGNRDAKCHLGHLYVQTDEEGNIRKAFKLFQEGADEGHAESMFFLGLLLIGGGEVEMDHAKGYMWLTLASVLIAPSKQGVAGQIKQAMGDAQMRLSEEDMERGREMAWEWQRKRHARKGRPASRKGRRAARRKR